MTTLALRAAGIIASASEPRLSLLQRLLKAREDRAKRRVLAYLAAMDDDRLHGLGFAAEDIGALRSGALGLPR